jgi:hypothetical protein
MSTESRRHSSRPGKLTADEPAREYGSGFLLRNSQNGLISRKEPIAGNDDAIQKRTAGKQDGH